MIDTPAQKPKCKGRMDRQMMDGHTDGKCENSIKIRMSSATISLSTLRVKVLVRNLEYTISDLTYLS